MRAVLFLLLTVNLSAAFANEKAFSSINWLKSYQCPVPGTFISVKNLETPDQVNASATKNYKYAEDVLAKTTASAAELERFVSVTSQQRRINSKDKRAIAKLEASIQDSAGKAAVAMVNWSLSFLINLSNIETNLAVSGRQHPLNAFENELNKVDNLNNRFRNIRGLDKYLAPIRQKLSDCLYVSQNSIFKASTPEIIDALKTFKSTASIQSLIQRYRILGDPPRRLKLQAPQVLSMIESKRKELYALEQMAVQEREALAAKARAEQQAKARERQLALVEASKKNLPYAKQFIDVLNTGSLGRTSNFMSDAITFYTPNAGTKRGKTEVLNLMSQASGGRVSSPSVDSSGRIYGTGVGRKPFIMYLTISDKLVSRIELYER